MDIPQFLFEHRLAIWYSLIAAAVLILAWACLAKADEYSLESAKMLIAFTQDAHPDVESWSFLLAAHGFAVPKLGLLRIDGLTYQIARNGSLAGVA